MKNRHHFGSQNHSLYIIITSKYHTTMFLKFRIRRSGGVKKKKSRSKNIFRGKARSSNKDETSPHVNPVLTMTLSEDSADSYGEVEPIVDNGPHIISYMKESNTVAVAFTEEQERGHKQQDIMTMDAEPADMNTQLAENCHLLVNLNNAPGANARFPYAEELNDALHSQTIADLLTFTIGDFKVVLFLQWLIKREISSLRATLELILNWTIILTFIAVLVNPFTVATRIVGGIAIFFANVNLHFWYGFSLYPRINQRWSNPEAGDLESISHQFNLMRNVCSMGFHGDERLRSQSTQQIITYPVTFLNHLAAYVASHFSHELVKRFNITGRSTQENQAASAGLGIFAVSILYTFLFGISYTAWGPLVATIFYFVNYHLYNSMLFRMSFTEFLIDCITGNLFAVIQMDTQNPTITTDEENPPETEKSVCGTTPDSSFDSTFDAVF